MTYAEAEELVNKEIADIQEFADGKYRNVAKSLLRLIVAAKIVGREEAISQSIDNYVVCTECKGQGYHVAFDSSDETYSKDKCMCCDGKGIITKHQLEEMDEPLPDITGEEDSIPF